MANFLRLALALLLVAGTFVNASAAWKFATAPLAQAADLGLPIVEAGGHDGDSGVSEDSPTTRSPRSIRSVEVLLQLTAVLLAVLAAYYAYTASLVLAAMVTKEGARRYLGNVVFSIAARLAGVAYYAVVLLRDGGPSQFRTYLLINTVLAVLPAVLLFFDVRGHRRQHT